MKTQNKQICLTCRFWHEWSKGKLTLRAGMCRRFPHWIETDVHHYCGEWRLKDDPVVAAPPREAEDAA